MGDHAALFGFDPPEISPNEAVRIAAEHWGVSGAPTRLRGERSHNTLLTSADGERWILQVQSASEDPAVLDLQTSALRHLEQRAADIPVSRVVLTGDGEAHARVVVVGGTVHLARLVTYLPGTTFDPSVRLSDSAYEQIGAVIGRIAECLGDFEHPAAVHPMPWDIANGLAVDDSLRDGIATASLAAIRRVDDRLHQAIETAATLPRRTIHNDGHAANLVRPDEHSEQVVGVIDFGDLVHTVVAADVAVIAESFTPEHPDPAAVVAAVTAGYHDHVRLSESEIAAIPDLVLVRTALNVLLGDFQVRHAPHLAAGAAEARPWVVDRMLRWSELDAQVMVGRIHDALERRRSDS